MSAAPTFSSDTYTHTFHPPDVSQADIASFHQSHFCPNAIDDFALHFLGPPDASYNHIDEHDIEAYEDEDDGLGYYADGVKRTLTDEQIEIFRHSELEALRRVQTDAQEKLKAESAAILQATREAADVEMSPDADSAHRSIQMHHPGPEDDGSEDGEIESDTPKPALTPAELKRQKRKNYRQNKQKKKALKFNPEPKEDLRKRTWDKVEAGMDSLDYDELDGSKGATVNPASQRRCISYDD